MKNRCVGDLGTDVYDSASNLNAKVIKLALIL